MKTQKEFLEALRNEHNNWFLTIGGHMRQYRTNGQSQCPLTAVAGTITGRDYMVTEPLHAAVGAAISRKLARRIIEAADNPRLSSRLRKRMLEVLGLEEN